VGEWKYCSSILELGIRWRSAVSFEPLSLYPWGNSLLYSVYRRLSRPRAGLDSMEKIKNVFPLPGIET
jgi:hypothetical protein